MPVNYCLFITPLIYPNYWYTARHCLKRNKTKRLIMCQTYHNFTFSI